MYGGGSGRIGGKWRAEPRRMPIWRVWIGGSDLHGRCPIFTSANTNGYLCSDTDNHADIAADVHAYRDSNNDATARANRHEHTVPADGNMDGNCYEYAAGDRHQHTCAANRHVDTATDSHKHTCAADRDADSNPDADSDADANRNADPDADPDKRADRHVDAVADCHKYPAAADCGVDGDRVEHAAADPDTGLRSRREDFRGRRVHRCLAKGAGALLRKPFICSRVDV